MLFSRPQIFFQLGLDFLAGLYRQLLVLARGKAKLCVRKESLNDLYTEIETELKECADSSREWDGKMEHLLHILT